MPPDNTPDILHTGLYDPPTLLTPFELSNLASKGGLYPPGTVCCIVNGERGFLNDTIRRVQISALRDLYDGHSEHLITPEEAVRCSRITHCAVSAGSQGIYELYWPRARFRAWGELSGSTIYFRRFAGATDDQLARVAACFEQDIVQGVRYDILDLPSFYWRWHIKVTRPYRYSELFGGSRREVHVCSTRVVHNHARTGLMEDPGPTLWKYYPAEVAYDDLWDDIGQVTIR